MESVSQYCYRIFQQAIDDYHIRDDVNAAMECNYDDNALDALLYKKSWIDTVQWHLEDLIRDPAIDSRHALDIKRRIDALNQKRTDLVEQVDDYFQNLYSQVVPRPNATHNTESLGWAIDRLSILSLKEFHIRIELSRADASVEHIGNCQARKQILDAQRKDLLVSINRLNQDIRSGRKINKVYRQLKMYNDPSFNPVLYKSREQQT